MEHISYETALNSLRLQLKYSTFLGVNVGFLRQKLYFFNFKLNLFLFSGQIGTAEKAKQRVRSYFQGLRDQLNRQEVAALTVVETYIRERLCFIRLLET